MRKRSDAAQPAAVETKPGKPETTTPKSEPGKPAVFGEFIRQGGHMDPPPPPKRKIPELPDNYQAIVTSTFAIPEPMELYRQVEDALKSVKASKASTAELLDALDNAQEYARLARQLYVNAKATVESVELDTQMVISSMRDEALATLEAEKAEGTRKKAITNDDVTGLAARAFPDEWKAAHDRLARSKLTLTYLDSLCERTAERARDLRAIVSASRGV